MKGKRKDKELHFWILWVLYTAITFFLFYSQAINRVGILGKYATDFEYYTVAVFGPERLIGTRVYPILFDLMQFFGIFCSVGVATATALTILNSLTPIVIRYCWKQYLDKPFGYIEQILVFVALFVIPIYIPYFNKNMLIGVCSPNLMHNATTLASKAFSIFAFFAFIPLEREYHTKITLKNFLLFSASLFLSVMAKPCFAYAFLPVVGLYLLYDLFRYKCKYIVQSLKMFLAFVPTFIALGYQFYLIGKTPNNAGTKIAFGWCTIWGVVSNHVFMAIICGLAFPIFIFAWNIKDVIKSKLYMLTIAVCASGTLEALCLYEDGPQKLCGNFFWQYSLGMFLAFVVSLLLFIKTYKKRGTVYKIAGSCILSLHLIYGVIYFTILMFGSGYGIEL